MGGGKGGGGEAAEARKDEQERQQRIREGTQRINTIFDGGFTGSGLLGADAVFDPTATYYTADGSVWSPVAAEAGPTDRFKNLMSQQRDSRGGDGSNGARVRADGQLLRSGTPQEGDLASRLAQLRGEGAGAIAQPNPAEEAFRKALAEGKLFSGRTSTGGFDSDFFGKRRQAYIDYATPQLEDQYGKAQKELTFALDRAGLLDSSVRGQKVGDLQQMYDLNKQQIADQALSYEKDARTAVEDARSNLIATLNATGDAQGAANAALSRSAVLSKPASFSPLSNLFADFTAGLGTQAALERANYYSGGQAPVRYQTGIFAPKTGTVKVT